MLKRLRVAGSPGSRRAPSNARPSDCLLIDPDFRWALHDTGWTAPSYSDVIAFSIYAAPGFDVTSARLDDITCGD